LDEVYSTLNYPTQGTYGGWYGFTSGLPSYPVVSVTISLTGQYIGDGEPHQFFVNLGKTDNATFYGNINAGCTSLFYITPTGTPTTYTTTIPVSCWATPPAISNIDGNTALIVGANTNGSVSYYIDALSVEFNTEPLDDSLSIDNIESSPSGQFALFDLSGETATVSGTMRCTVRLLERCSQEGYAGWTSDSSIATIFLDATNTAATTSAIGGGFYYGHDWGGTDNTWLAEDIQVPYNAGYTCDYPYSVLCSDGDVYYYSDYQSNNNLIATPSAAFTTTLYTEPEPTDPLAWIVWKIKQTLIDLFGFKSEDIADRRALLTNMMEQKAPFAYVEAVQFNFDTSTASTVAGSIHIDLANTGGGILPDIDWSPPAFFNDAMGYFRQASGIFLWLAACFYIIVRIRMVFKA